MGPLTISAIASGIGTLYGAITGNARRRRAERETNREIARLTEERDREINSNYLNRADSQAVLREVRDNNEEMMDVLAGTAAKSGISDEAKVAAATDMSKNTAKAVSQLSAVGQQHKDNVQNRYQQNVSALKNQKIANLYDTSGADNLVANLTQTAGQIAQLYGAGAFGGGEVSLTKNTMQPMQIKQPISSLKSIEPDSQILLDPKPYKA